MDEINHDATKSLRLMLPTEVVDLLQQVLPDSVLHINALDRRGNAVKLLCSRDTNGQISLDLEGGAPDLFKMSDGSIGCSIASIVHPVYLVMNEPPAFVTSGVGSLPTHQRALITTIPLSLLSSDGIVVKMDDLECDQLALSAVDMPSAANHYGDIADIDGALDVNSLTCDALYGEGGGDSQLLLDSTETDDAGNEQQNICADDTGQQGTGFSTDQTSVADRSNSAKLTTVVACSQFNDGKTTSDADEQNIDYEVEKSDSAVEHDANEFSSVADSQEITDNEQTEATEAVEYTVVSVTDVSEPEFSLGAQLNIQMLVETVENVLVYSCYFCDQFFPKLQTLKGHVKRQHNVDCNSQLVRQRTLLVAIVCRQCGYVGTSEQATRLHIVRKHRIAVARQEHACKTDPRRLMSNRRRMESEKAAFPHISCIICGSEISLLKNYDGHVKKHHANDPRFRDAISDVHRIQFERSAASGFAEVTCPTCGETHDTARLVAHVRWKHGDADDLHELFRAARDLIKQVKTNHVAKSQSINTTCPQCGRALRQISLANHLKFYCTGIQPSDNSDVTGKPPVGRSQKSLVKCDICGKSVPRPKLPRHRRLEHKIGVYKPMQMLTCTYCPREFAEPHLLRKHIKKHTGESVVVCLLCFTSFVNEYVAQIHLQRVHCAEYGYNCVDCGRGFWKESSLRQHVCMPADCNANVRKRQERMEKMAQLQQLNKPLYTVVNPYDATNGGDASDGGVCLCLLCKKPFRNRATYNLHHRTVHMSVYPHNCASCGRHFVHARQMHSHKCRPEKHAANVQKEMACRVKNGNTGEADYVGPTFVMIKRHADIARILGSEDTLAEECGSDSEQDNETPDNTFQSETVSSRATSVDDQFTINDNFLLLDANGLGSTSVPITMKNTKTRRNTSKLLENVEPIRSVEKEDLSESSEMPVVDNLLSSDCMFTSSSVSLPSRYATRKRNISFAALANGSLDQ